MDNERTALILNMNSVHFCSTAIDSALLKTELTRDSLIQRIMWRVVSGNWTACSEAEGPFKRACDCLTIENGILYYRARMFIPPRLRYKAFEICHCEAHSGARSTYARMKLSSWWLGMFKDWIHMDVEKWIHRLIV